MAALADIRQKYPQYDDMSDEDFAQKFYAKFYSDMPFDQFAQKIGYTPAAQPDQPLSAGDVAKGVLQTIGAGVMNIPHGVVAGVQDIAHRLTGNAEQPTTKWGEFPIQPGTPAANLFQHVRNALPGTPNGLDVSDEELRQLDPTGKVPIEQLREQYRNADTSLSGTVPGDVLSGALHVGGDVANILPGIGATKAVGKGVAKGFEAAAEAAGEGTPWETAGFRNGSAHPIARQIAGDSGQEALQIHNQQIGNTIGAAEAGHPADAPMSYETLADARGEPNAVWNRTANALPTQELDQATKNGITNAAKLEKVSTLTDADQQRVAQMAARMTSGPRTGEQVVEDLRTLRQEGFKRSSSEDVDQQNIGKAQLDMARALEGYVGKALPKNADVSLEQFQAARKALAKNWTVQSVLHGNDVDLQALARVQRADPDMLDGGLKVAADFANGPGRDVTALPPMYNPPSAFRDAAGIFNIHRPVQSTIQGLPGVGSTARSFLTGDTAAAIDRAKAMFPGRPAAQLAPLPRFNTNVPPGMSAATPPVAAPAAAPSGIPFADVLSHGVEQRPSPGLSVGPMGLPAGEGVPFRASPEAVGARIVRGGPRETEAPSHIIGPEGEPIPTGMEPQGPKLGDRFALPEDQWFKAPGDVAGVRSQGVPEGIVTRTAPGIANRGGSDVGSLKSASPEAINRVRVEQAAGQDRFLIDPDGKMWPIRGVEAVDAKAPKGSVIVQKGVGAEPYTILDRGGLPQAHAKGLLNRALAGGTGLSLSDLTY